MSGRFFWGSALVVIGLALLAANLGYIEAFNLWGLWPILILWPALRFLTRGAFVTVGGARRWVGLRVGPSLITRLVALWVAAGAAAQLLYNLGLIAWDWGDVAYWSLPVLLVLVGVVWMARPRRRSWAWNCSEVDVDAEGGSVSSFVGDLSYGRRPWEFKSPVTVDLWAGDIDIDLTTARFSPGDNHLYVSAWAGDVDIEAPEGIDVKVRVHCGAGHARVFGRHRDGLGINLTATRPAREVCGGGDDTPEGGAGAGATEGDAATPEPPRLHIDIDLTFGDVTVR